MTSNYVFTHNVQNRPIKHDININAWKSSGGKRVNVIDSDETTNAAAATAFFAARPDAPTALKKATDTKKAAKTPTSYVDNPSLDKEFVSFVYPYLNWGETYPSAKEIQETAEQTKNDAIAEVKAGQTAETPENGYTIKQKLDNAVNQFNNEIFKLKQVANDGLIYAMGSALDSVHCDDDWRRDYLNMNNNGINVIFSILNLFLNTFPEALFNKTIDKYNNEHNNKYKTRVKQLKDIYNSHGSNQELKDLVNKDYDPYIAIVKEETAVFDASINITQGYISHYEKNVIPSQNKSLNIANIKQDVTDTTHQQFSIESAVKIGKYYDSLAFQNSNLEGKLQTDVNSSVENDRKSGYKTKNIDIFLRLKYYLFIFYYVLVFVILVMSFFEKTRADFITKLIIAFIIGIFPYVIYPIEMFLYNTWNYVFSIMTGVVYTKNDVSNENDMTEMRKPKTVISEHTIDTIKKKIFGTV